MSQADRPLLLDHSRLEEAIKVVRSRSGEMDRSETRRLLVAEMQVRGLMLPPPAVDYLLDEIMSAHSLIDRTRRMVHAIGRSAQFAVSAIRFIREPREKHRVVSHWDFAGMRHIVLDPRQPRADIVIDSVGQQSLAAGERNMISVWLERATPTDDEPPENADVPNWPVADEGNLIKVFLGQDCIGALGPEASDAYRSVVQEARDAGVIPVVLATRSQADNGSWRLQVGLPRRREPTLN